MELSRRDFLAMGAAAVVLDPATVAGPALLSRPSRVRFRKVVVNADSDFECACVADIDGDGRLEIVCGDTFYHAPDWRPTRFREFGVWGRENGLSGYRNDFADLPMDVTGNGLPDLLSVDYPTGAVSWWENPGKAGGLWVRRDIARPGSMETALLAPILGPGTLSLLPNCVEQVVWYELVARGKAPKWREHLVGREGAGHGVGWGDINGDGRVDIITPRGWYEQVDAATDRWIWRPEFHCDPDDVSIGMPVLDVEGHGLRDVIFGSGHHYGLFRLRRNPPGSLTPWTQTVIDASWSQVHSVLLADLEGHGRPAIVTGKRYLAHDHDVGALEPLGIDYYMYDRARKTWTRFVIDEGTRTGAGLQLPAVDLRRTGRLDLVCAGKSGLYLFMNEGLR